VAFVAAGAIAAVSAPSAPAVTAGWMLNGTMLAVAPLATTAGLDKVIKVTNEVRNIECEERLELASAVLLKGNVFEVNSSLAFTDCFTTNALCSIPTSIKTVPLLAEATLDGTVAAKAVLRPQTGNVLATVKFSGESCPLAGVVAFTGDWPILMPTGQEERTDQAIQFNVTAAEKLLVFGMAFASAAGEASFLVGHSVGWSFL
jgi:hypothetical protein